MEPSKAREIAEGVATLAEEFAQARHLLTAIVRAKLAGTQNPRAWQLAFKLVDKWGEAEVGERPGNIVCPECDQILPNVAVAIDGGKVDREPLRIDCGPVHVLHYTSAFVEVVEGKATVHPRESEQGASVRVFSEGDDQDGGSVSGGAAGGEAGERSHGGSPGDRSDDGGG